MNSELAGSCDLSESRRMVIKIGSLLLADQRHGAVHRQWLQALAQDIDLCRRRGQEVIVVSSGAIAIGRHRLGLAAGPLKLDDYQAAAAAGMARLVHAYEEVLGEFDISVGQILLTLDDTENRRRYINARNTLEALLKLGAVPLINENDTVATDEIRFGDNDRLGARVAAMTCADTLVLLSDVDGLYSADPRLDPKAKIIPVVNHITAEIEAMAGPTGGGGGSGGMVTKLAAAKIATAAGCRMVIANGRLAHPIRRIENGEAVTWFLPQASPRNARQHWIAGSLRISGTVIVDDGALRALRGGNSLLPAGVVAIDGDFQKGDAVAVKTAAGQEVARGLIAYSAAHARLLIGHKSSEIEGLLGYRGRDELIHRNDLVLS